MTEERTSPPAPRRSLLEWLLGSVPVEVPQSRLAEVLKSSDQQAWNDWLMHAARTLGWAAERVEASIAAVTGEWLEPTLVLFELGAVPILVDPGIGLGRLRRCLYGARPEPSSAR